jgi:hypothetical protein
MLHEVVRPALAGLMKNDNLLDVANRAVAPSDETSGPLFRNAVGAVARNLDAISQLLGRQFPQDANASAHASAALIKSRLQAVALAQNDALNLIEGYVQTQDMGRARDELPGAQGYNAESRNAGDPPTPPAPLQHSALSENLAAQLKQTRARIGSLEDAAGIAVMSAAEACSSPPPQTPH